MTAATPRAVRPGRNDAHGASFHPSSFILHSSPRSGFTLIELLVVIAVIAILSGMLAAASLNFITMAKVAATRTTIKKVDEAVITRVNAINRWNQRKPNRLRRDWAQRGWLRLWRAYGLDIFAATQSNVAGNPTAARKVLSRKWMMKASFPLTQGELKKAYWFRQRFNRDGTQNYTMIRKTRVKSLSAAEIKVMNKFLNDIDKNSANNATGKVPGKPSTLGIDNRDPALKKPLPGEIFLFALKNAPVFGALPMTADDFEERELIDQDKDGVPELGDAWGNPLYFYRWPTRLVNNGEIPATKTSNWHDNPALNILMPNARSATLKQDPDDRAGYLSLKNPVLFGLPIVVFFHDMYTWHAPLVVSAGPDGELGLAKPSEGIPIKPGGTTVLRYGLARPLYLPDPATGTTKPQDQVLGYLYDDVTNHNGDGGL